LPKKKVPFFAKPLLLLSDSIFFFLSNPFSFLFFIFPLISRSHSLDFVLIHSFILSPFFF
ncbi:unnamed protein product, partial [Arabidopsis halleri]